MSLSGLSSPRAREPNGTTRRGVVFALNRGDEASRGYFVEHMAQSLERYFNFGEATRCRDIHGGHNPFDVAAQNRPLLIAEHHKRDCTSRQILLIARVFVSRQQNIEARGLRRRDRFAIRRPFPSPFNRFDNDVALEGVPKRSCCQRGCASTMAAPRGTAGASRPRAANSITATT